MPRLEFEWAVKPIPFSEFRAQILELYGPRFRKPATLAGIDWTLRRLDALGVESTAEFTPRLIARFVESISPGRAPLSIHQRLRQLRAITNFAARAGYVQRPPFLARPVADWVSRPRPTRKKRHLSREELQQIRAVMISDARTTTGWLQWRARRTLAMFDLFSLSGLRKMEGLCLQLSDLDLQARTISLRRRTDLKTESSRETVVMPVALVKSLEDWLLHRMDAPPDMARPKTPYLFPNVRTPTPWLHGPPGHKPIDRLKAAAKRAGIEEGVTIHALRRSLATHMLAHGAGSAMIAKLLRHSDEETAKAWYTETDIADMRRVVEDFHY
jgi:integrase